LWTHSNILVICCATDDMDESLAETATMVKSYHPGGHLALIPSTTVLVRAHLC